MAGTFIPRIEELQENVGTGKLVMRTNVHQPYAAAEHQRAYYRHPRGGMADFMEMPFQTQHGEMLQDIADAGIENLKEGAIQAVQKFDEWLQRYAPVQFDVLRNSGNLYVEDNGSTIFEKPQTAAYEEWKE